MPDRHRDEYGDEHAQGLVAFIGSRCRPADDMRKLPAQDKTTCTVAAQAARIHQRGNLTNHGTFSFWTSGMLGDWFIAPQDGTLTIVLMAGGKISNRIDAPKFSKVVVAFIPNEPPRWPTMTATIKKMVDTYSADARKYERLGQWAERIGWEKFFEKCDLEFTHHLIDDFRDPAYYTWRQSSNFKFT